MSTAAGVMAVAAAILSLAVSPANASSLTVGVRTAQALITDQLFTRSGRWYLLDDGGVCYAYLETPHVHFTDGRLVLDAHLSSKLGQRLGDECAGAAFASNVTVSGQLRGAGSKLSLNDIRIDHVQDDATRTALTLALQLSPQSMPKSFTIDIIELVRGQELSQRGLAVRLDQFRIADISTRNDGVTVQFDLNLSAP